MTLFSLFFLIIITARRFYVLTCLPYKILCGISANYPVMSAKDALETLNAVFGEEIMQFGRATVTVHSASERPLVAEARSY